MVQSCNKEDNLNWKIAPKILYLKHNFRSSWVIITIAKWGTMATKYNRNNNMRQKFSRSWDITGNLKIVCYVLLVEILLHAPGILLKSNKSLTSNCNHHWNLVKNLQISVNTWNILQVFFSYRYPILVKCLSAPEFLLWENGTRQRNVLHLYITLVCCPKSIAFHREIVKNFI